MAEYIERESAISLIEEKQKALCPSGQYGRHYVYGSDRETYDAWEEIIETLEAVPSADVAPVVHGLWIGEGDGYADGEIVYDVWHCSECDHTIDDGTDDPDYLPNYCPNCGALMDKEGTDE